LPAWQGGMPVILIPAERGEGPGKLDPARTSQLAGDAHGEWEYVCSPGNP